MPVEPVSAGAVSVILALVGGGVGWSLRGARAREEEDRQARRLLAQAEELARLRDERDQLAARHAEQARWGHAPVVRSILHAVDDLDRALAASDPEDPIAQGVTMARRSLLAALERHGVTPVDAAPGLRFDPQVHEAVEVVPCPPEGAGLVVRCVATGYRLHDRLLRPARVVVGRFEEERT